MDAAAVAATLGLDERHRPWLADLERHADGEPLAPLVPAEIAQRLRELGCSPGAVDDALATLPDPAGDPAWWWLLERCHRRLVDAIGDPEARLERWPLLPDHLGLAGRCFALHWYAATVPATREWHRRRGIPEAVTRATLSDLGRHEAIYRRLHGSSGVDAPWWMTLHVRGLLLEVGPLQYEPAHIGDGTSQPWYDDAEAARRGPRFRPGDASLGVHIPAGVRLDPAACVASMRDASALCARVHPTPGARLLTCSSWLLDDQLADHLPADANILAFQRSFELVPGWSECDEIVLDFTFRKRGLPVDARSATTRLQRAALAHLAAGRHFRWRTGWRQA